MEHFEQRGELGNKLSNHPSPSKQPALAWDQMGPKIQRGIQQKKKRRRWPILLLFLLGILALGYQFIDSDSKQKVSDNQPSAAQSVTKATTELSTKNRSTVAMNNELSATPATEMPTKMAKANENQRVVRPAATSSERLANQGREIPKVPKTSEATKASTKQVLTTNPTNQIEMKVELEQTTVSLPRSEPFYAIEPLMMDAAETVSNFWQASSYGNYVAAKVAQTVPNPPVEIKPNFEKQRPPVYLSVFNGDGLRLSPEDPGSTEISSFLMDEFGLQLDFTVGNQFTFYTGLGLQAMGFQERFSGSRVANIYAPGTIDTIFINTAEGTQFTRTTDSIPATLTRNFRHENSLAVISAPLMLGWNSRSSGRRLAFELRGGVDVGYLVGYDGRTISTGDGFSSEDLRAPDNRLVLTARLEAVSYLVTNKKQAGYLALSYRHPISGMKINGIDYNFSTLSLKTGYYLTRF